MQRTVLHPAGSWDAWPDKLKRELQSGETNERIGDTLVHENNAFRVWTIHLPPGRRMPFHKHARRYCWTSLSAGRGRSRFDDGSVVETVYQLGTTQYFENLRSEGAFIHDLENIGDTMLIFSTIEFTEPADLAAASI